MKFGTIKGVLEIASVQAVLLAHRNISEDKWSTSQMEFLNTISAIYHIPLNPDILYKKHWPNEVR
jgi:hypothetical protein